MIFENDMISDFKIQLKDKLVADILNKKPGCEFDSSLRWCDFVLKPKFYKWCLNECSNNSKSIFDKNENNTSLRLIDIEKYNRLYNEFKQNYSESAMKVRFIFDTSGIFTFWYISYTLFYKNTLLFLVME